MDFAGGIQASCESRPEANNMPHIDTFKVLMAKKKKKMGSGSFLVVIRARTARISHPINVRSIVKVVGPVPDSCKAYIGM